MTASRAERLPVLKGGALALCSALLFGASTPLIAHLAQGSSPFLTAALLYAGAALAGAAIMRPQSREARLQRADLKVLIAMTLCGAIVAPVALAWGLQRTGAAPASLMLTLEALFTALLARRMYDEQIGARAWGALLLITTGAAALLLDASLDGQASLSGLGAIVVATLAWGTDDALSRALSGRDPGQVILFKGVAGAAATAALALGSGASPGELPRMAGLVMVGILGYGLSLKFYLLAQRTFGAARTGSLFAFVPFIGALGAMALGEREPGAGILAGGLLMMAGVVLHLSETHDHPHTHAPLEHTHAHRHDDGHHTHVHTPPVSGSHNHVHRHEAMTHAHPHMPEEHHRHDH